MSLLFTQIIMPNMAIFDDSVTNDWWRQKNNFFFFFLLSSRELSRELTRKTQVFPCELVSDSRGFPAKSRQNSSVTEVTFAWKNCYFHA